jgi:ankyrin repeat protein
MRTLTPARPLLALGFLGALFAPSISSAAPPQQVQQQLIHAVIQDQIEAVPALLAKGGDPNARVAPAKEDAWALEHTGDDDSAPPLMVLACRFGSIQGPQIVRMLIDKGANVNLADKNGVTPLMVAAQLGMGSVELLLEHGAKVNAWDANGLTPLMYAANNRGYNTVATLLDKGADINAQDKSGQTPLMVAIRQGGHDPIMLFGEDLEKKRKEEQARYLDLIRLLLDHKPALGLKDASGTTALQLARNLHQPEVVKLLRSAGAKGL